MRSSELCRSGMVGSLVRMAKLPRLNPTQSSVDGVVVIAIMQ